MRVVCGLAAVAALVAPYPATARVQGTEFSCTVAEVAVFYNRVHIFCGNGGVTDVMDGTHVRFFAVGITDPMASHVVTIASAAMASGRPISIAYAPTPSSNPEGCGAHDCRKIAFVKGYVG